MFLVVEFAKYGDLLNYLRQRREQVRDLNVTFLICCDLLLVVLYFLSLIS